RIHLSSLPPTLTEYALLRLLQPYGRLTALDFLFTPSGEPRGYAFASFSTRESAEAAIVGLNGRVVGGKRMAARWAKE
ncbi:RNA-binding domain-containing protein, partial [Atractiella rhizophila]